MCKALLSELIALNFAVRSLPTNLSRFCTMLLAASVASRRRSASSASGERVVSTTYIESLRVPHLGCTLLPSPPRIPNPMATSPPPHTITQWAFITHRTFVITNSMFAMFRTHEGNSDDDDADSLEACSYRSHHTPRTFMGASSPKAAPSDEASFLLGDI